MSDSIPVTGVLLDFGEDPLLQIRNATIDVQRCARGVDVEHARTRRSVLSLLTASAQSQLARLYKSDNTVQAPSELRHFVVPVSTLALGEVVLYHCADSPLSFNMYASRSSASLQSGESALVRGPAFLMYQDGRPFLGSGWVELDHCVVAGLQPLFESVDNVGQNVHSDDDGSDASDDDEHHMESSQDTDSTVRHRHQRMPSHTHRSKALGDLRLSGMRTLASKLQEREFFIHSPEAPAFVRK